MNDLRRKIATIHKLQTIQNQNIETQIIWQFQLFSVRENLEREHPELKLIIDFSKVA